MSKINIEKFKWAWVATQINRGWRIRLDLGRAGRFTVRGLVLSDKKSVEKLLPKGKIVFIERPEIVDYRDKAKKKLIKK